MEKFLEKEAVKDVTIRMYNRTDSLDWEALRDCFTPKVVVDMKSVSGKEPAEVTFEQLRDMWIDGLKTVDKIQHNVGNFEITLNEKMDAADIVCVGIAYHYGENEKGKGSRLFVGTYNHHAVKVDGEWRLDKFKYNMKFIEGKMDL